MLLTGMLICSFWMSGQGLGGQSRRAGRRGAVPRNPLSSALSHSIAYLFPDGGGGAYRHHSKAMGRSMRLKVHDCCIACINACAPPKAGRSCYYPSSFVKKRGFAANLTLSPGVQNEISISPLKIRLGISVLPS